MCSARFFSAVFTILAFNQCSTAYVERGEAGPDYLVQGEYTGESTAFAAQVIARGDGAFELVVFPGGLPGDGWNGAAPLRTAGARADDSVVRFSQGALRAEIADGTLSLRGLDGAAGPNALLGRPTLKLTRIERHSPTQGVAAPPGAQVLFAQASDAGPGLNATDGRIDDRGLLAVGAESNTAFGSMQLHLEFQTPFMPDSLGQARGNSGVYLQGRYEVQVLDSFGLDPASNDCAGIYEVAAPSLNMSFPPLQWQTYDIDFEEAQFNASGGKVAPAHVSVRHNGVLVHDRVAIPEPTGLGEAEDATPGRLLLQYHLDPVFYRNVWVLPR
ncbi:MAG: DUF1080 domain-containing protein [Myxococcota bacterium]|nr:DUF1080 domain-containing protein [Myxococcota bacterium]